MSGLSSGKKLGDRLDVPVALAAAIRADDQVLAHREAGEHAPPLGDERDTHAHALVRGELVDRLAVEQHVAGGGALQTGDGAQQRGLAASVGADEGKRHAFFDLERDLEERLEVAVEDVDVFELEDDIAHSGVPPHVAGLHLVAAHDLVRIALDEVAAEADGDDALHDREESVDDVLDPDDRDALAVEVLDGVDEDLHLALGEPPGDLVQEQHFGVAGEGAGELEPLAVEQGQQSPPAGSPSATVA